MTLRRNLTVDLGVSCRNKVVASHIAFCSKSSAPRKAADMAQNLEQDQKHYRSHLKHTELHTKNLLCSKNSKHLAPKHAPQVFFQKATGSVQTYISRELLATVVAQDTRGCLSLHHFRLRLMRPENWAVKPSWELRRVFTLSPHKMEASYRPKVRIEYRPLTCITQALSQLLLTAARAETVEIS